MAAGIEDCLVIFEDTVCEVVLAQELPDVFDGIEFWRVWRQRQQRDVLGNVELSFGLLVVTGSIHDDDGVSTGSHHATDLRQMLIHRFHIGARQDQPGGTGAFGTDRAEQIGPFVALVPRRLGARPAPRPAPRQAAFLADARFVLKPDLDRLLFGALRYDGIDKGGEVFLNAS